MAFSSNLNRTFSAGSARIMPGRLIFENTAIGAGAAAIAMYRSNRPSATHASTVVSVNADITARQLGVRSSELEQIMVQCTTLDRLVEKHQISAVDILQIDTEGHDCDVLMTLNLSKISPFIIQFEHGHLSPGQINEAIDHLNAHGYRVLYGGYQSDSIALHGKLIPDLDCD
jgi:FkbM family methyltransferase